MLCRRYGCNLEVAVLGRTRPPNGGAAAGCRFYRQGRYLRGTRPQNAGSPFYWQGRCLRWVHQMGVLPPEADSIGKGRCLRGTTEWGCGRRKPIVSAGAVSEGCPRNRGQPPEPDSIGWGRAGLTEVHQTAWQPRKQAESCPARSEHQVTPLFRPITLHTFGRRGSPPSLQRCIS